MELRPSYKQTEVGVIPEEWDVRDIRSAVQLMSGHHILANDCNHEGKGTPYITGPADFPDGVIRHTKCTEYPKTICRAGDILITVKGAGVGTLVLANQQYCISRQLMAIRPLTWDTTFLYYCLLQGTGETEAAAAGLIPGLSRTDILGKLLAIPPLPEQRAIAAALSDVDAQIAALDALLAKQRALKQAAMQQLLTGRTRLPGFEGEWETRRIGELAAIDNENLPSNTNPDYAFNYISLEDVNRGTLRGTSEVIFRTAPSRARRVVRTADILFGTVRPNLQSHLLVEEVVPNLICSTGFAVIRCVSGVAEPAYVYAHLFANGIMGQVEALLTGSNYPAINGSDVAGLEIPYPNLDEQRAIAAVLSDMDAEIAALDARIAKTRLLKQAMMQELLTGRTRLV